MGRNAKCRTPENPFVVDCCSERACAHPLHASDAARFEPRRASVPLAGSFAVERRFTPYPRLPAVSPSEPCIRLRRHCPPLHLATVWSQATVSHCHSGNLCMSPPPFGAGPFKPARPREHLDSFPPGYSSLGRPRLSLYRWEDLEPRGADVLRRFSHFVPCGILLTRFDPRDLCSRPLRCTGRWGATHVCAAVGPSLRKLVVHGRFGPAACDAMPILVSGRCSRLPAGALVSVGGARPICLRELRIPTSEAARSYQHSHPENRHLVAENQILRQRSDHPKLATVFNLCTGVMAPSLDVAEDSSRGTFCTGSEHDAAPVRRARLFCAVSLQYQHFFEVVAVLALGVATGVGSCRGSTRKSVAALTVVSVALAFWNDRNAGTMIRAYGSLTVLMKPAEWAPNRFHASAQELRCWVKTGSVLTLAPAQPLEANLRIYPEFANGPFAWRSAAFVAPERRKHLHLIAPSDLPQFIHAQPPVAILVGVENAEAEKDFIAFARDNGYRSVSLGRKKVLWIQPPPALP